jgi:hypothetical protein
VNRAALDRITSRGYIGVDTGSASNNLIPVPKAVAERG